jgi:hypothetical protein
MNEKLKKAVTAVLLCFVLISIGFAIGKEVTLQSIRQADEPAAPTAPAVGQDKVVVYYMHATFRCVTCNLVESTADELIRTEFDKPLRDGRLEWKRVNYQENEELARRYDVGGNMIVVVRFRDGKEADRKRLDRVMELAGRREEFLAYVRQAIEACLAGGAAS